MADLTSQHLDAEEDYIVCRGHILIASAAEEAIKKKTWKHLLKPKHKPIQFEFSSHTGTGLSVYSIKICMHWNTVLRPHFFSVVIVIKSPEWETKDMAS